MKIDKTRFITISLLMVTIFMVNNSSAAIVDVTTGKLPTQLQEGKQIDFTIKIKNYEDAKQLILETNLVPSVSDKPLWNFGESESIIDVNRYQQKIILNLSSLPAVLNVAMSGKVPDGIDRIKCNDIVLNRMHETKLKFYEVHADEKLAGIESFELVINTKEEFENTLQQIRRTEFDGMKQQVRKLFYMGITAEAQSIVTEMSKVTWPDSITLFWIFAVESDILLNVIVILVAIIMFAIGYVLGSRDPGSQNE